MSPMSFPRMLFSSETGWPEIEKAHPAIGKLFLLLVLPLTMLPPAMLYYAGTHHGEAFLSGFSAKPWEWVAVLFFAGEILSFLFMGWFIRTVADSEHTPITAHDAYVVAAIGPIPMWLSSLGLFVPNFAFNAALALAGLGLACTLVYHGVSALCHTHEELSAANITYVVMAAGMVAWALLLVGVFLF